MRIKSSNQHWGQTTHSITLQRLRSYDLTVLYKSIIIIIIIIINIINNNTPGSIDPKG